MGRRKIAAIVIAVKGSIPFHGSALNCNPDLSHFDLINPGGLGLRSMTSMARLAGKAIPPGAVAQRMASVLPTVLGFDMTIKPLARVLEDTDKEQSGVFTGIPAGDAYTGPRQCAFQYWSATNG